MAETNRALYRKWSTTPYKPADRYDAWQEELNASHLNWTLLSGNGRDFFGEIESGRLHDLQVVRCACGNCSGTRGAREIAAGSQAYYCLLLVYEGEEEVRIGSDVLLLHPGNIMLWDSTIPMRFRIQSPTKKISVFIPQPRMADIIPASPRLVGRIFDWRLGLGAVASAYISTLQTQLTHIDTKLIRITEETVMEIIATGLGGQTGESGDPGRMKLLSEIKDYIEGHLDNPELSPRLLADAFGISQRYLHLLFSGESTTVSRWIQLRRLERCRHDLIMTGPARNITEVAFAWGFNDSAHFSQVFKKRYGLSPREYRRGEWGPACKED